MPQVVFNRCFGRFGLSDAAIARWAELSNINMSIIYNEDYTGRREVDGKAFYEMDIARDDPNLLQVIQELGCEESSGEYSDLAVSTVPSGMAWEIKDYDGIETVIMK